MDATNNPVAIAERSSSAESATRQTMVELVGRGIAFPFETDDSGDVRLTRGDDVRDALHMIIMTAPGERVMRPEFGCAIWDHVFSPVNTSTLGQMAHAVRQALSRWEPRIEIDSVTVRPDLEAESGTTVHIEIDFRLRSTNDRRNLVYPFYVIPQGG